MLKPLIVKPVQVKFVKTVVGYWNLYLVDYPHVKPVNLSPAQFREIFPEVSPKARLGCDELDRTFAKTLFASFADAQSA
ncbi:hypothetical protein PZE06_18820 [Robertmurraya sp. DFI.2.37]|uniref:hypothetical protein n=1 Tax=Robertmurraya sp. DFI.2.37 TaxID=3031819 RepID=UPI0023DB1763|nr:hypothetical protein [Robertmurraya sp. DFI.2.37]MDF1510191.1 hypothetical protein [Robertmurraya sp. DFI.2.37]